LGLSLAREIIRAHGGDLSLEASDEQFTRFAVKLPATA
jgi:signal transduction histidine kinase